MACAARRCSASDEASSSIESPSTSSSRVCSSSNDTSAPPSISSSVSLSEVALSAATRQRSTEQTKVTESTDSCCVEYERQDHRRLPAVAAAGGAETAHSVRAEATGTAEVGGTGTVPGAASSRGGLSTGTTAEGTAQLGATTPAEGGQAGLRITNTGAAVDATCGKTAGSVRNSEETQCKTEDFSKQRNGRIIEMNRTDDAESCGNVVPPTGDNSSRAGSVSSCDGKGEYIVPSVSLCCSSNSRRDRDSSIAPDGSSGRQPASGRESSNSRSANDADATAACFCMSRSCSSGSCTSSSAAGVRPRAKEDDLSEIGAHQKQQRRVQSGDPGAGPGESSSRSSVNSSGTCDSSSTDNLLKLSNSTGSSSSSIANTSSSCSTFEARLGNRDNFSVLSAGVENAISSCGLRTLTPAAESSSSINCSHRPGAADSSSVGRDSSTFVFACVNDSSCNSGASEIAGSRTDNAGGSGGATYKRSGSSTPGLMGSGGTCGRVEEKDQRGCAATVAAGVTPQLAAATDLMAESAVIMPTPTAATTAAGITAATTSGEGGDKSTRQRGDGKSEEAEEEEEDDEEEEEVPRVSLTVKWNSKLYDVSFTLPDYECFSVADLKERLQQELSVPADKQKLLGFTNARGGRAADTDLLQHLKFKKENQLLLIGSSDADLLAAAAAHAAAMSLTDSVIDDFAGTTAASTTDGDELRTPLHLQRLEKAVAATHVQLLHPPREGKKLLVLDLDYTLFDCKTLAGSMDDLKRPFLNEFMESVFEDYDIAVWSQTHWKWVEMKCTELGLLTNPRFHLCFVLDRSSMFTICSRRRKKKAKRAGSAAGTEEARTHEVKALEVIWRKFPDRWNAANTIHVDDLSRNFAFNPQNGIRISAYRREKRHKDSELLLLSIYLKMLSKEKDVSAVRHKHWKDKAADLANGHSSSSSSTSSSGSGGSPPSQQRPRRGRE